MSEFQCVGIQTRLGEEAKATLEELIKLLDERGLTILAEQEVLDVLANTAAVTASFDEITQRADLVIVVGGDGSMLGASRDFAEFNIPLLGVNRGRLGFLTDILPSDITERVDAVLTGEYSSTERFLLHVTISRNGELISEANALNDIVLHPGKSVRMMELELYIDQQFVYSQRSDGLIVSTPTGSTAYALSAGGPILHPRLNALVLVPMNAHTLTSRPIVISGDSSIEILVGPRNEVHPQVACDGQDDLPALPGDVISISRAPNTIKMLHPKDHNFYQICQTKLGWGSRLDKLKD